MKLKIEKNIPLPKQKGGRNGRSHVTDTIMKLTVGDSFLVSGITSTQAWNFCKSANLILGEKRSYAIRCDNDRGYRIWRKG